MVVNRPEIILYTCRPDEDYLKEICAGIEEEGVLYQVCSRQGDLDTLAFEAAAASMMGCGKNVFELNCPRFWQCRNLGANSARAVKKMPFKSVIAGKMEESLL